MPDFIGPILDKFVNLLTAMPAPDGMATPFLEVRLGAAPARNFPNASVIPTRTQFAPDMDTRSQGHGVTVRVGVTGSDPEAVVRMALAYVRAVDLAYAGSLDVDWPEGCLRRFVIEHDYGAMYQGKESGGLAMWPELHFLVECEELT
jgi:hypothetical protein